MFLKITVCLMTFLALILKGCMHKKIYINFISSIVIHIPSFILYILHISIYIPWIFLMSSRTGKLVDWASRCIFLWCLYAWFMICLMCDMHCDVFNMWFATRFFNLLPYEWSICFVCCVMCEGFVWCVLMWNVCVVCFV